MESCFSSIGIDKHSEGNVLKHTIMVVNRSIKDNDIDIAIAAMFHDIGKDVTAGIHPKKGHITHFGHEKVSAMLSKEYRKWIESVGGNTANVYYIIKNVLDNAIKVNVGEERFQTIIKKADIALDKADQRPNRFAPGDSLDAMIADLNLSQRKVKLSIKELEKQQEKEAVEKYGSATSGSSLADILGTALKKKEDK